jgi:hypothetical protein
MGWIAVAASFAIIGLFPGIIDWLAQALGIGYPPVLGLTGAIAILVIKILLMDIERSHLEMRNQRMIQRIAMMEADLKSMRKISNAAPLGQTQAQQSGQDVGDSSSPHKNSH